MGESRLIVEELLALCLQRITMEEDAVNTEQGEADPGTVCIYTHTHVDLLHSVSDWLDVVKTVNGLHL